MSSRDFPFIFIFLKEIVVSIEIEVCSKREKVLQFDIFEIVVIVNIYVLYILNKKDLYFYYNIFIQVLMKKHPENQSIVAE